MASRPYLSFLSLAVMVFVVATVGSDVVARIATSGESVAHALAEHIHYAFAQPAGLVFLAAPFLMLAWISASLVSRKGLKWGLGVFLLGALLLGVLYFTAYQDSQVYIQRRMWTAAALSVGLLPFKSLPVVLLCLGCRWYLGRKVSESES